MVYMLAVALNKINDSVAILDFEVNDAVAADKLEVENKIVELFS